MMRKQDPATTDRAARIGLDLPVAALAAISVGFAAFAMPADLFAELVRMTGLPALIPAAQPPLGSTARIAAAAGAAIAVFAIVFLLLRLIGRIGGGGAEEEAETEDFVTPRLRRRDLHPDAPPRPPLSAHADLGEPEARAEEEESRRLSPFWLPDDFPEADHEEAERWVAEEAGREQLLDEPELVLDRVEPAPPPPAPEPILAEPIPAEPFPVEPEPVQAEPVQAEPPPSPAAEQGQHSIAELIERLEQGLARRRAAPPVPAPPPEPTPAFVDTGDDRLQQAIESLQRLAARQH